MRATLEELEADLAVRLANPGWNVLPNDAERAAHLGLWIAKTPTGKLLLGRFEKHNDFGLTFVGDCGKITLLHLERSMFWPVDDIGVRIAWPVVTVSTERKIPASGAK